MMLLQLNRILFFSMILSLFNSCKHSDSGASDLETHSLIPSTVPGVQLQGTHIVVSDESGPKIIRSQEPSELIDYQQLKALGLTDVLIFKKQNRDEVETEIENWKSYGISGKHTKNIPMMYAKFPDFKTPCLQTLEALRFIHTARSTGRVLFHCSAGEDRTGYLAGLVQVLEGGEISGVFKNEMCRNGYSHGDPRKGSTVCAEIDRDLTPLFLKMAYYVKSGKISWEKLDNSICNLDPVSDLRFKSDRTYDATRYRCKPSDLASH